MLGADDKNKGRNGRIPIAGPQTHAWLPPLLLLEAGLNTPQCSPDPLMKPFILDPPMTARNSISWKVFIQLWMDPEHPGTYSVTLPLGSPFPRDRGTRPLPIALTQAWSGSTCWTQRCPCWSSGHFENPLCPSEQGTSHSSSKT